MSNGARHGLGVVAGLVLTPIIAACLIYGTNKLSLALRFGYTRFRSYHGEELWIGAGVILLVAVLLGLLTGSRLSPVASLIPGAAYTLIGLVWFVSPTWAIQHPGRDVLSRDMSLGYTTLGAIGIFFLLGVLLLAASLAPSRWKARAGAAPRYAGPPPAPMGPPPMPGAPAPMGAAPMGAAPMGAPQPPPSQSPPWQGAPQFGAPPAQPAASNPPPLPPASPTPPPAQDEKQEPSIEGGSDDDEPGEWTRMYGGNRPK